MINMMKKTIALLILLFLLPTFSLGESRVVRLGDYMGIGLKLEECSVSEDELNQQIDFMRSLYAEQDEAGERVIPELSDGFVRENLGYANVEEYKQRLKALILDEKEAAALEDAKSRFLNELIEISELELDEEEIATLVYSYKMVYQEYSKQLLLGWAAFCNEYFAMTEEEFEEAMLANAEYELSSRLLLQELAKDMEISLSEEAFAAKKNSFQESYGLSDDELEVRYPKEQLRGMFIEELVWERLLEAEA